MNKIYSSRMKKMDRRTSALDRNPILNRGAQPKKYSVGMKLDEASLSFSLGIDRISELLAQLEPFSLRIEDESYKHSNHYEVRIDSTYPSHIKISIISSMFDGLSTLTRHKLINEALKPAFLNGLHAVSIKAYSLEEKSKLN